jgi:four helix bundle protein
MNFEHTRIYSRALELVSLSRQVIAELPVGCGFLSDQLRRASASVVLNFAEGYDKGSLAEQRRFFRMSRGSAQEVLAIFDVAERLGAIRPARRAQGRELCDHLVRMLVRFRAESA